VEGSSNRRQDGAVGIDEVPRQLIVPSRTPGASTASLKVSDPGGSARELYFPIVAPRGTKSCNVTLHPLVDGSKEPGRGRRDGDAAGLAFLLVLSRSAPRRRLIYFSPGSSPAGWPTCECRPAKIAVIGRCHRFRFPNEEFPP